MSKVEQMRAKYGASIREALGAGEGSSSTLIDHPAKNKRYESTRKARGYFEINLSEIIADPQHRESFDNEELRRLADSLTADGLIAPIVVRWDQRRSKYVIIAGERRYRAANLCKWKTINCEVKPDNISPGEIAEVQLAENHARKNLNPIELATAFQDVIDKNGYTIRDLAKRVGVNETTVTRYIRMLGLPEDIRQQVAEGSIPVGVAREAARINDEAKQRTFLQKAINEGYSATQAQKAASGKKGEPKKRIKSVPAAQIFPTEFGNVTATIKTVKKPSYDHIEQMLEQALEEVRLRIKSGIRL